MKYKIFSDLHKYSPIEIDYKDMFSPQDNYVYLGDNIDLANCSRSDINKAKNDIEILKKAYGPRFCSGNHCLSNIAEKFIGKAKDDSLILFEHGDISLWGSKRSFKYRSKNPGAGWFKRTFLVRITHFLRQFTVNRLNKKAKERIYNICKVWHCDTYVCGHKHPKELMDIRYKDIRIIVVPRGVTEIDV